MLEKSSDTSAINSYSAPESALLSRVQAAQIRWHSFTFWRSYEKSLALCSRQPTSIIRFAALRRMSDQRFVEELAARLQLSFYSGSGNVPQHASERKISLETAARDLRHQWFAELIQQGIANKIATAHTLDDQAETVLMRILRGTGARGLAGIAPTHNAKHLVRPLLT